MKSRMDRTNAALQSQMIAILQCTLFHIYLYFLLFFLFSYYYLQFRHFVITFIGGTVSMTFFFFCYR